MSIPRFHATAKSIFNEHGLKVSDYKTEFVDGFSLSQSYIELSLRLDSENGHARQDVYRIIKELAMNYTAGKNGRERRFTTGNLHRCVVKSN